MLLVVAVVLLGGLEVLAGRKRLNEFPGGVQHGSDRYWRLYRAHANAIRKPAAVSGDRAGGDGAAHGHAELRAAARGGASCELPREALPKRRDKNATWRASAVFVASEVEQLISDERVDWDRRMLGGLLFLAGLRWGEAVAAPWSSWEPKWAEGPLGRLLVARSYQWQSNTIKATKTEVPRWVPVHPTLAKMLAEWKLSGWQELMGRAPGPDDLIIPPVPRRKQKTNVCRPPQAGLRAFHADCKTLGIRTRRNHDTRRTFISLARAAGARLDLLTWITHGPSADIMDAYTTLPWATLCEQVAPIKIQRREGKLLQLPNAVGGAQVWAQVPLTEGRGEGILVRATGFEPVRAVLTRSQVRRWLVSLLVGNSPA